MKKFVINVTTLIVTFLSLALVARGQVPAGAGAGVVVVPPSFPEFLPIKNQAVLLDWAVTNQSWNSRSSSSYSTFACSISYTRKDGVEPFPIKTSSSSYKFRDWNHFWEVSIGLGKSLLKQLRDTGVVDPDKTLVFAIDRGYADINGSVVSGETSVFIRINLGSLNTANDDSFGNTPETFFYQAICLVNGLEKFEVCTSDGIWVPRPIFNGYIKVKQTDVCTNTKKIRYRITAKGVTTEYTQSGDKIVPPSVVFDRYNLSVSKTPGSRTVVETSDDLVKWSKYTEYNWNDLDNNKATVVYPLKPSQYFRAYSE
jgi:hypothetical protein